MEWDFSVDCGLRLNQTGNVAYSNPPLQTQFDVLWTPLEKRERQFPIEPSLSQKECARRFSKIASRR